MNYILEFVPYIEEDIDINYYADIEKKISKGETITQNDAENFLRIISFIARKKINPNLENFDNKCDLAQSIIGHYLDKINCKVSHCSTLNTISEKVLGHNFSIVELNVEGKAKDFLVDLTYIQFFKSDNCTIENYFTSQKFPGSVLLTPDPGYFIKEEDKMAAQFLLRYGYIELTPEYAKMYGDSFYNTKKGVDPYPLSFKSMPASIYMKMFKNGTESLSTSNENLILSGQNIVPFSEQKSLVSRIG